VTACAAAAGARQGPPCQVGSSERCRLGPPLESKCSEFLWRPRVCAPVLFYRRSVFEVSAIILICIHNSRSRSSSSSSSSIVLSNMHPKYILLFNEHPPPDLSSPLPLHLAPSPRTRARVSAKRAAAALSLHCRQQYIRHSVWQTGGAAAMTTPLNTTQSLRSGHASPKLTLPASTTPCNNSINC
jgi:hypothetical protein